MKLVSALLGILLGSAILSGCSTPPPGNVEMYPVLGPHPSFSEQLTRDANAPPRKKSHTRLYNYGY